MRRMLLASAAVAGLAAGLMPAPAAAQNTDVTVVMKLIQGFTQTANYIKGLFEGIQRNTDADNVADLRVQRDFRNAQIRDEHVATPTACESLDNAQTVLVGAGQSWVVRESLSRITDPRGEAQPGYPSYRGQAVGMAAFNGHHLSRYCSPAEAADGLCGEGRRPNFDQRASSMVGPLSYGDMQEDVDAALDYSTTLAHAVALRHPRGAELRSAQGQEIMAARRWYNAMHSLARWVANDIIGRRVDTVVLTDAQKAQMAAQGLAPADRGSWMLAMELDVKRRLSRPYAASLQRMPPASRVAEHVQSTAMQTDIQWETYKLLQAQSLMLAALVGDRADAPTGLRETALQQLVNAPAPQPR